MGPRESNQDCLLLIMYLIGLRVEAVHQVGQGAEQECAESLPKRPSTQTRRPRPERVTRTTGSPRAFAITSATFRPEVALRSVSISASNLRVGSLPLE